MSKLMNRLSHAAFNRPANITSFWTDLESVVGSLITRNIAKVILDSLLSDKKCVCVWYNTLY